MVNPFVYDRPLLPDQLVDREEEARTLLVHAEGGHNGRLSAPRRYGKTSLLRKVIADADEAGMTTVYINFYGVLSIEDIAMRIEEAYRRELQHSLRAWMAGVIRMMRPAIKPPGTGIAVTPQVETEAGRLLYSLLDLPVRIFKKTGRRTLVVFDEFQDVLDTKSSADGLIRSRIELHGDEASYIFAGSHPGLMAKLFGDRAQPLYGQARAVPLEPLRDDDLADYIDGRFGDADRQIGEIVDPLLSLVRGHPQRAMLIAHHLWEATPRGQAADEQAWVAALDAAYLDVRDAFDIAWKGMRESDRRLMAAVAEAPAGFLQKPSLERFDLPRSTAEDARDRLVEEGHLQLRESRALIVDPLFEAWIAHDRQGLYPATGADGPAPG